MRLKEAKSLAKYRWICVHPNGNIYEHADKPYTMYFSIVGFSWNFKKEYDFVGIYTGSKNWASTLRKVK